MTRPEISVGLAGWSDVVEISLMSQDLIEKGLRWSWTPRRVAASVRSPNTIVVVARAEDQIAGFGIMRYGDHDAHLDLLGARGLARRLRAARAGSARDQERRSGQGGQQKRRRNQRGNGAAARRNAASLCVRPVFPLARPPDPPTRSLYDMIAAFMQLQACVEK